MNNNRIEIKKYQKQIDFIKQCIPILIGMYIFFNPFPHTTAIKEIFFYLSAFLFLLLIIARKKDYSFKTPLLLPFVFFVLWSFFIIIFALDKENSLHDLYSHLLKYIILYYVIIYFVNSKNHFLYLSWTIIISSSTFVTGGLIYYYIIMGNLISERFGSGFIRNGEEFFAQTSANVIGIISVFAILLALNNFFLENNKYRRLLLTICIIVLLIGIFMTQLRSSILCLLISIFIIFLNNKKIMFALMTCLLAIIIFTPIKEAFIVDGERSILKNRRRTTFGIALEVIKDYPITGIGFGMQTYEQLDLEKYKKRLPKKYWATVIKHPHNILLDITVRLGIVGLAISIYIIFAFFKMCWDILKYGKDNFIKNCGRCLAAAFISFIVIGFFHPVFSHMPEVVFCTIFSMTTIVWNLNKDVLQNEQIEDS